jgi:heme/copper-type cytochrome/quinol oxidase subunit 2
MTELPLCGQSALIVLWTGGGIAAAIFALIVYSIISFCKSPEAAPATFVHRTAIEVIWAVIPILILVLTATPAVKNLLAIGSSCPAVAAGFR